MSRSSVRLAPVGEPSTARLLLYGGLWVATAIVFVGSGLFASAPRPIMPLAILGPVVALVVAWRRSERFRAAVDRVPTTWLVAFHLVRVPIGAAFLVLHAQGALPGSLAIAAGVGDIVVGLLAAGAVAAASVDSGPRRRLIFAWNALALADILMVVATAQRLLLFEGDDSIVATLGHLPMGVVPTVVVPLVIATHGLIFWRLRRAGRATEQREDQSGAMRSTRM